MTTPTVSLWYAAILRKKAGPFTLEQLRDLLLKGQLTPSDMVLPEGAQKWIPVSTVDGLFEQETVALPVSAPNAEETKSPAKASLGSETVEDARRGIPASESLGDFPALPGYEILQELGRGGMGIVYKARDRQLRHLVAIKMPLPHCIAREEDRERFLREARAAAGLRHPNICPIHRVDEFEGRPFLVLAFIEGEDLRAWMKRANRTARACAEMVARLARAVAHAHQHGVVHRDIKPANTMIELESDEPILMDFGLAKELGQQDSQLSHSGQILGTPAYMAPEQAGGHIHQIGPPADVYSLGAVLYHLLCKRPPFEGNVGEIIGKVQTEEPTAPRKLVPAIHRDLETICLKALQKEPARRYESAIALAEDLERFAAGEAILARREGLFARVRRFVRRNRVAAGSLAALLLAVVVASFVVLSVVGSNRLRQMEDAIRADFVSAEWSADHLEDVERRIDDLESEVPERGPVLRLEARQALFAWASGVLKNEARLEEELHERIRTAIRLLQTRDASLARDLEAHHKRRLDNLNVVFQLIAPFEQVGEVFGQQRIDLSRDKKTLASGNPFTLSTVPSAGRMQVEATFGPSWERSTQIGLLLNASRSRNDIAGYSFLLSGPVVELPDKPGRKTLTFAEARAEQASFTLRIRRNGIDLREQQVEANDIPSGPLRLEAKRDRDRLTLQVNNLPPLEFRDLFTPSQIGVIGLVWPNGVPLESFVGYRKKLSEEASPLERGDDLFQSGRTAEALALYREQARLSAGTEIGQEARFKEGIALAALKRYDEAAPILESVSGEAGKIWPHVAASNLWVVRLRQERFDDADLVLDNLLLRRQQGAFSDLSLCLPSEYTNDAKESYYRRWQGIHMLRHDPARIRNTERALQVNEMIGHDIFSWTITQQGRLRAYCLDGQATRAFQIAQEIYGKEPVESRNALGLLADYGAVAREVGKPADALRELDRRLFERPNVPRKQFEWLLVERARLLAALGKPAEAEKSLLAYIESSTPTHYRALSDSYLMLGFLREERGDSDGAKEAWNQARFKKKGDSWSDIGNGTSVLNAVMAGGLSGEGTEEEATALRDTVLRVYTGEPTVMENVIATMILLMS